LAGRINNPRMIAPLAKLIDWSAIQVVAIHLAGGWRA
jgi:hypothetical protein